MAHRGAATVCPGPAGSTRWARNGRGDHPPARGGRQELFGGSPVPSRPACLTAGLLALSLLSPVLAPGARAEKAGADPAGVAIRLDGQARYTLAARLVGRDPALLTSANWDDGDRNFAPGLVSNRLDLLAGINVDGGDWGGRVSAATWYDTVYRQGTDAGPGATVNSADTPAGQFPTATRRLQGRDAALREAYVRGAFTWGGMPVSLRAGRQVLTWGEGLFGDPQSIAAAQAPIDYSRAIAPPGAYRNDNYRPVAQVVLTMQPRPDLAFSIYRQLEWRPTLLPGSGSYFSYLDQFGSGGDRLFLAPGQYLTREPDQRHASRGQFGLSMHVNPGDVDYGFYVLRYNGMEPQFRMRFAGPVPAGAAGAYQVVYPGGTRLYGVSASTVLAEMTLAGEVSLRRQAPLYLPAGSSDAAVGAYYPGYVRGSVWHGQVSLSTAIGRGSLWDSADINAELAVDHVPDKDPVDADRPWRRPASRVRVLLEPHYFRVLPNVDVTLPIGLGYNLSGHSLSYRTQNAGAGDMQIGIAATYRSTWKSSLTLTRYLGSPRRQWLADRDYLSFGLERAF